MNVELRPLTLADMPTVEEIEKEAFPTLWPPTPFKRELGNRHAQYLVAWAPTAQSTEASGIQSEASTSPGPGLLGRIFKGVKGLVSTEAPPGQQDSRILGFVGLWFMVDEAHITSIAVRETWRGKGIGELLLIGAIELAMARRSRVVSLEVRLSNVVAQSLYEKYGFKKAGIRKGYYTDNREDALVMTTDPIDTPAYQEKLKALLETYRQRRGRIVTQPGLTSPS